MVDHQGDAGRLDHAPAVPRAPRAEPLAAQRRFRRGEAGQARVSATEILAELNARIDIIEEAYEYFLAYASQGLPSDQVSDSGRQARHYLGRCDTALTDLGGFLDGFIDRLGVDSAAPYRAFHAVIDADAR